MPVLKDLTKETIELKLPFSGAKVQVLKTIPYGYILDASERGEVKKIGMDLVLKALVDWDFVLENKEKAIINEDNIKKLSSQDIVFITHYIEGILDNNKNKIVNPVE